MDDETARRLDAIERRLRTIEDRMAAALPPPLPGRLAGRSPDREAMPVIPLAKKTLPEWLTPTNTQAEHDRYAANMQSAYDGSPAAESPPAVPRVESTHDVRTPADPLRPQWTPADEVDALNSVADLSSGSTMSPTFSTSAQSGSPGDDGEEPATQSALPPVPSAMNLEQVLGLKWAGWVGAIVLVIGAALGVKYAYDQGWLGGMPDSVRCAMIALAGFGLIAGGEVVFRRVNRLAATGLFGAGVAVLYLAAYAGQAWYGLFAPPVAVVFMALAALVGMAIAARADLVSIAALSVIGATACPFWFDDTGSSLTGLRVYFIAIQVLAIGLCAWRAEPKWWTLRGLALAATTIGLLATLTRPAAGFDVVGMTLAALSAVLYQGELIFTTSRRDAVRTLDRAPGLVFSLIVTAALTLEWLAFAENQSSAFRGQLVVTLAAATFVLGRISRWPRLAMLARGFDVQTVLLLVLAVPIWLDGPAMLFGWIILAAGLSLLGVVTRDRHAVGAAAAVWGLAVICTFVWITDSQEEAMRVWLNLGSEPIVAAVVVAMGVVLVGHLTAYSADRFEPDLATPANPSPSVPRITLGLMIHFAAAATLMATLVQCASPALATRGGMAYAVLLWAVSFWSPLVMLGVISSAVLAVVAVKWATVDVLTPRLSGHWTPTGRPFLNSQTATGVLLAGLFALIGWTNRGRLERSERVGAIVVDQLWTVGVTLAVIAIGFAASLEVDRAIALGQLSGGWTAWPKFTGLQLVLTMLWSGCLAIWLMTLRRTLSSDDVRNDVENCARLIAYLLAIKFAFADVISPAFMEFGPTPTPILNLRTLTLGVVIGLLAFTHLRSRDAANRSRLGLAVLALLWVTGSAEIDRYAVQQTQSPTWIVRQVGWSIYWGSLAVATLLAGFALRARTLRLAALGLLAATLLKVTLVDLAGAGTGWRILSFLGLGALLLLTSVLYGKFEMRMKAENDPPATS